jgi:hypothetical protein
MKLKVFMWQVFHDRLQTGEELEKRNWKGNEKCLVCGVVETRDHILFCCPMAKFIWACFSDALGWGGSPDNLQEMWEELVPLGCSNHKLKLFLVGVVFWSFGIQGISL